MLVFFTAFYINVTVSTALTDIMLDSLKSEGMNILETLIKSKGNPENWELSPASAQSIGLAYSPYNLSTEKITALSSNCDLIKDIFNVYDYKLTIMKNDTTVLLCGYESLKKTILIERPVFIKDEYGKIMLELW